MGCGCKTKTNKSFETEEKQTIKAFDFEYQNKEGQNSNFIVKNLIKIVSFSIALLLLPIIMIAVVWFMFELLVLNQEIDMKKIVTVLTSKLKRFNDDDGYDDEYDNDYDEEYDDENYEMLDVDDITPSTIK
jgi:hypothetical protein